MEPCRRTDKTQRYQLNNTNHSHNHVSRHLGTSRHNQERPNRVTTKRKPNLGPDGYRAQQTPTRPQQNKKTTHKHNNDETKLRNDPSSAKANQEWYVFSGRTLVMRRLETQPSMQRTGSKGRGRPMSGHPSDLNLLIPPCQQAAAKTNTGANHVQKTQQTKNRSASTN